jgi:hypothetical protein
LGGRPQIDTELRALIRRMSMENPLWGAPRIHGELLKLGFEIAQSSVAKYMVNAATGKVRPLIPLQIIENASAGLSAANHWQRSPGKVCPLDDVSRISTIRRALRLRYDGECLSDRLGRNLKLTVNPRYEIGRVHDHEFSSI